MVAAERGQTIETRRDQLAGKQRVKIISGEEEIYRFVKPDRERVLSLPRLEIGSEFFPRQRFQEDVRFDPETGALYTTRWEDMETTRDSVSGRLSIVTKAPEDLTYIAQRPLSDDSEDWEEIQDPEDLDKRKPVKRLVTMEVWDGLEPAIRQQFHILERADPASLQGEPQEMRRMIYWMDRTSRQLRAGNVTEEQLEQWASQAAEHIGEAHLSTATNSDKQKIATMLMNAAKLDSLGRINPQAARFRLSSAVLAARRRILTNELITRKFSANLGVLVAEREETRADMDEAYNRLRSVHEKLQQGSMPFEERGALAREVRSVAYANLRYPRVAPYLIPSRLAAILLAGCREQKKDLNRRVLGDETAEDIFSRAPAAFLLEGKNVGYFGFEEVGDPVAEAERRVRWAYTILDDALSNDEYKNI